MPGPVGKIAQPPGANKKYLKKWFVKYGMNAPGRGAGGRSRRPSLLLPGHCRSIACCGKKGNATSPRARKKTTFQKAARMTGGKAGAAAPRAGAREEKRAHSPGRGGMERSRRFRRRALHPFFLFMSCDTNAGITIQDTERPFHIILYCHKKSFHQSCEMIFL